MLKKYLNLFQRRQNLNDSLSLHKSIVAKYNRKRLSQNRQVFCKAPFTSFNIKPNGIIGVCNVNTSYSYGKYPEKSLIEIWNGHKIKKLRNCMQNYDLSQGCVFCHKYVEDGNFHTLLAKNYDSLDINNDYPSRILFETSHKCNLKCIMCFVSDVNIINSENIYEYDESFLKELSKFVPKLKVAIFHGGEPFLIPLYYKIWEMIIEINPECEIKIITNGTILNNRIKELLNKANIQILLSLESLSKTNYENIRIGAGFGELKSNLEYFINYSIKKRIPMVITSCVMQQNWKDIVEIVKFCNKYKCMFIYNTVFFPYECSIWNSSQDLIAEIIEYYKKASLPKRDYISLLNSKTFNLLIKQLRSWKYDIEKSSEYKKQLGTKTIHELENILSAKYEQLNKTFQSNNETVYNVCLEKFLDSFNNETERTKAIINIVSTPSYILNESLKFENGLELLFGKK